MEKKAIIIFLTLIQLSVILTTDKTTTIFIAGDSIAAERDTNNDNPERGLGQMLKIILTKILLKFKITQEEDVPQKVL